MAKKLGKKNKKKGIDGRDFAVIGGYVIFLFIIGFLYAQASSGNKEVKKLETQEAEVQGQGNILAEKKRKAKWY